MEASGPSKKAIIGLVVIVLLVIAATGVVVATSGNSNNTKTIIASSTSPSASPSSSSSASNSPSPSSSSSGGFKDGSYNATGTYDSPGGQESIDVNVTLADSNGTVSDVSVTPHANVAEASDYQSQFVSGYKSQVVGKKISDINLSRVAGSSLTSIGFNSAIEQIEQKAKA